MRFILDTMLLCDGCANQMISDTTLRGKEPIEVFARLAGWKTDGTVSGLSLCPKCVKNGRDATLAKLL